MCSSSVETWCHCHICLQHIILASEPHIQGVNNPVLLKFISYDRKTWIISTVYKIPSLCVLWQPIHTNNDVDGWHRRPNKKAIVVTLLHTEASLLPIHIKLVSWWTGSYQPGHHCNSSFAVSLFFSHTVLSLIFFQFQHVSPSWLFILPKSRSYFFSNSLLTYEALTYRLKLVNMYVIGIYKKYIPYLEGKKRYLMGL
jgi:hypothetical protein